MIDALTAPWWVGKIVDDIRGSDFAELALVVHNQHVPAQASRWRNLAPHLLYSTYLRVDRKLFGRVARPRYDAFAPVDLGAKLAGVPVLPVLPEMKKFTDRFPAAEAAALREADLDVIFRFGFRILKGDVLTAARYGIWSFHHGDNREYRGGPPSFWEMYEKNPVAGAILQILTDKLDGGKVIYRSLSKTNTLSLFLTKNRVYLKTSNFALRRLRDLHQHGFGYIEQLDTYREQLAHQKPIYRMPDNSTAARFLGRIALTAAFRAAQRLTQRERWFVAIRPRRAGVPPAFLSHDLTGFTPLPVPAGHFHADPFLWRDGDQSYVFFEDHVYAEGRARIAYRRLDRGATVGPPTPALTCDYHLSYPFLFAWNGTTYMLPETRSAGAVQLFRAEAFPDRWVLDRTLIDGIDAVDPTLFEWQSRWWLALNVAVGDGSTCDELSLFVADTPLGPFRPHAHNPVLSDVRRARSAGRVFLHEGALIRPAQDCGPEYGHAVRFQRIDVLDEQRFALTELGMVGPDWLPGNVGTHTYNCDDRYEVIDGRLWRGRWTGALAEGPDAQ